MKNNYEKLCEDFLYPDAEWEFIWELENKEYALAPKYANDKSFVYCYYIGLEEIAIYNTLDEALDSILYKGRTLKEALIETDFTFRDIM